MLHHAGRVQVPCLLIIATPPKEVLPAMSPGFMAYILNPSSGYIHIQLHLTFCRSGHRKPSWPWHQTIRSHYISNPTGMMADGYLSCGPRHQAWLALPSAAWITQALPLFHLNVHGKAEHYFRPEYNGRRNKQMDVQTFPPLSPLVTRQLCG